MLPALEPGTHASSPLRHTTYAQIDRTLPLDYHNHTTWTDGTASSTEMAAAASAAGMRSFFFSEHIRADSTYFPDFANEIRALSVPNLEMFVGVEAKVLDIRGTLDAPPEIEDLADAIIGSVHSPPNRDGTSGSWQSFSAAEALDLELELALAIVRNSRAHIIGHPLGMCITKFRMEPRKELLTIARACAEQDKAFELNPRYCIEPAVMVDIAISADCKVNIGSDAHFPDAVGSAWKKFVIAAEGIEI